MQSWASCCEAAHPGRKNVEYTPWLYAQPWAFISRMAGLRLVLAMNLRALRAKRGLSQEELAEEASLDRTYVSALERERYAASVDTLERLAAALKVSPEQLLRSEG